MSHDEEVPTGTSSMLVTIPVGALVGFLVPASANAITLRPLSSNGRAYVASIALGALGGVFYTQVFNNTLVKLNAKRAATSSAEH